MRSKEKPSDLNLTARTAYQTLEDVVLRPVYRGIKTSILAVWNPIADHVDRSEAPGTYRLMLKELYPSFPNWHEDPQSKSKEPFNPQNPREGCAGEVFFLEKYEKRDPKLFERLMNIRIKYFENLKK